MSNPTTEFTPCSKEEWRQWLEKHHATSEVVWLIYHRKNSGIPSLTWSEAVDEALCFGWIDSTKKTIDNVRYKQMFTKRKPKSNWSKINKGKVAKLLDENRMMPSGLKSVEIAKENGSWNYLDDVEALVVPKDLLQKLNENKKADAFYKSLSQSKQKGVLYWLHSAKRAATREKRLSEIIDSANRGVLPKVLTF